MAFFRFGSIVLLLAVATSGWAERVDKKVFTEEQATALAAVISEIASEAPGDIGVALIVKGSDTIVVNNSLRFPMMSVFKLHQAIAVCSYLDNSGNSLDSIISTSRETLDAQTWSPMLKEHTEPVITLPIRELMRYSLVTSDNNASNLMFKRLVAVEPTDSLIARVIPRNSFQIAYTEEEMSADHSRAYSNHTSPLGAAMLINRLFTDSILSSPSQEFLRTCLSECNTGADRIAAPLTDIRGIEIAHKTGSGYIDNGILAAQNDVAYITLPGGISYSLAVFVKDFSGTEAEASAAIARISAAVLGRMKKEGRSGLGLQPRPPGELALGIRVYRQWAI